MGQLILNPKQATRSSNVTSEANEEDDGEKEMVPTSPGGGAGWQGCRAWSLWGWACMTQPRGDEMVKLGMAGQKAVCQVKQNALPAAGMGHKAAKIHHSSTPADIPKTHWWNILPLRNTSPQKMRISSAYCSNCPLRVRTKLAKTFLTFPKGRLLNLSGLVMLP